MADSKLQDWGENLLDDLASLQVDLIVKREIGGARVPEVGHALVDIVKDYYDRMLEYGTEHQVPAPEGLQRSRVSMDDLQHLRTWAKAVRKKVKIRVEVLAEGGDIYTAEEREAGRTTPLTSEERAGRMKMWGLWMYPCGVAKSGCDQLRGLFQRVQWNGSFSRKEAGGMEAELNLDRAGNSLVRKLWEVGLEVVVARTVIELDGDVVMRVVPEVFNQQTEAILGMQNMGVKTSVGFWRGLFDIARSFMSTLTGGK